MKLCSSVSILTRLQALQRLPRRFQTRRRRPPPEGQRLSPVRFHQVRPVPPQVSAAPPSRVTEPSQHITALEWQSGSAGPGRPAVQRGAPPGAYGDRTGTPLVHGARVASLSGHGRNILSACDPPAGFLRSGVRIQTRGAAG